MAIVEAIPSFKSALRQSVARDSVRPLFKAIDKKRLSSWLGLESENLEDVLKELEGEWTVEGDLVKVPVTGVAVQSEEQHRSAISGVNTNAGASLESQCFSLLLFVSANQCDH